MEMVILQTSEHPDRTDESSELAKILDDKGIAFISEPLKRQTESPEILLTPKGEGWTYGYNLATIKNPDEAEGFEKRCEEVRAYQQG